MSFISKIIIRLIPGLVVTLILYSIFPEIGVLFLFLIVLALLTTYRLLRMLSRYLSYFIQRGKFIEGGFKHLESLNFPDPKKYNFNKKDIISGELYFRDISNDESMDTEKRLIATEYKSAIETFRNSDNFVNLFITLRMYREIVQAYSKKFK